MNMNDMVLISVDDHISEPPGMFNKHLSGENLATAPTLRTAADGTNYDMMKMFSHHAKAGSKAA